MKTKLVLGAVAAAVAVFSQGAFAQASSPTRAEVKADAKKGGLAPAGEGPATPTPSKASDKTRDERKAQTQADKKSGDLAPAGDRPTAQPSKASDKTRDERKAQTQADKKAGKLTPAGEGPEAPKK